MGVLLSIIVVTKMVKDRKRVIHRLQIGEENGSAGESRIREREDKELSADYAD